MMAFFFLVVVSALLSAALGGKELPPPEGVTLVLAGFRHGNRNPEEFLPDDPNKGQWGLEGPLQLTKIGRQQAYALGQFLRKRYGSLVGDHYFPDQVKAFSSSAERCQMTTQVVLAGLFPPKNWSVWNEAVNWQPIPVEINDPMLRMYRVKCPEGEAGWKPIDDGSLEGAKKLLGDNKDVIDYVSRQTGWDPTLSKMANVADNLHSLKIRKLKMPTWLENPKGLNITAEKLFDRIAGLEEANQYLCTRYPLCRKMMAGHWLDQVFKTVKDKKDAKLKPRTIHLYGSHSEIVLSMLKLMQAPFEALPTASGFILEFRPTPAPALRLLYEEVPDHGSPEVNATVVRFPFCPTEDWCALDTVAQKLSENAFSDWEVTCKVVKCPVLTQGLPTTPKPPQPQPTTTAPSRVNPPGAVSVSG